MQMLCSVRSVEILHSVNAGQGYWSLAKFPILSVLFVVSRSRIGNAVGVQEQSVMSQQEASIDSMKIGRAFPNTSIQLSSAPNILEEVAEKTKIVIATTGSIPGGSKEYSAVVLLEGQRFLAASSSRFEELVYESFFEAAAHVSEKGSVFIVLDAFHPLVAAITKWNPGLLIRKILRENEEAFLPPFSAVAVLTVEKQESVILKNGLAKSIKDGRLPTSSQVFLSQDAESDDARILVSVPSENRDVLAAFLLELSRKRAISKKSFVSIALDPFTLLR